MHSECERPQRWNVVATSVRGSSHEKTGAPCQDRYAFKCSEPDVLIAAVADGAGSAAQGEIGAERAAQTLVDCLWTHRKAILCKAAQGETAEELAQSLAQTRKAIEAEAETRRVPLRELSSTLIAVIATPQFAVSIQIGDGAAVVGNVCGEIIALSMPQNGEYANETTFLTSPDALRAAQIYTCYCAPRKIALFSDGLQLLALTMPFGKPHQPFFDPLFHFAERADDPEKAERQLSRFLGSPKVRTRTDDDITLFLAALTDEIPCSSKPSQTANAST